VDHALRVQGVRPLEEALAVVGDRMPGARFGKGLPVALFVRRGGWVMAFEDNGGEGVRPEVLERVAHGRRAVGVYWNVNMLTHFAFADTGQVVATFSDGATGRCTAPTRPASTTHWTGWPGTAGWARCSRWRRGSPGRCSRPSG
jgi:hypothetical protein